MAAIPDSVTAVPGIMVAIPSGVIAVPESGAYILYQAAWQLCRSKTRCFSAVPHRPDGVTNSMNQTV